jgi:hypothetical protein
MKNNAPALFEKPGFYQRSFLKKPNTSNDLRLFRTRFLREIPKRGIPHCVIGQKQTALAQMRICGPVFPKHVFVRMEAVVNEDVDRADIGKKFRQETSSVTNH